MKTVLFISLPYSSHYLSMFDFAHQIENNPRNLYFTGLEKNESLIQSHGFSFINFIYIKEFPLSNLRMFFRAFLLSRINQEFNRKRYREYLKTKLRLNEILKKIKPEIIYLDEYIFDYYFIIPKKYKIIILNTRPSTKKVINIPPLNSTYIPQKKIISFLFVELLWYKIFIKRTFQSLINYIAYCGYTDNYFLIKLGSKLEKIYASEVDCNHSLNKSIKNLNTVNLSPAFFEFSNRIQQKNESFFYDIQIRNEFKSVSYSKLIEKIKKLKSKQIVYFCLGTLSYNFRNLAESLTIKVINTLKNNDKFELVISSKYLKTISIPAQNVHIFDYLPQLDFLNYCDIMINHGGIGSIKECIRNGVKIISYPLDFNTDQPSCAARVQALGFGLMGNIKTETEEGILKKLEKLANMNILN